MHLQYITTDTLPLFSGLIVLSHDQAARRKSALNLVEDADGGGLYEIITPTQFKPGEIIGLENPDKAVLSRLELTEESRAAVAAAEEERLEDLARAKANEVLAIQAVARVMVAGQITGEGLPKVDALAVELGRDVDAAERDALHDAWKNAQEEGKG